MDPTKKHPLTNQRPSPEPTSTTEKATTPQRDNRMKIVSYACLEASMRYREAFWRDDIEDVLSTLEQENKFVLEYGGMTEKRKAEKMIREKVLDLKLKIEKFNTVAYKELEEFNKFFTKEGQQGFDNYSTAYGLLADEMLLARNTTDLLMICKLYNAGQMDTVLNQVKNLEQAAKLNAEYEAKNNVGEPIDIPENKPYSELTDQEKAQDEIDAQNWTPPVKLEVVSGGCRCGGEEIEPHTCPYKEEIGGDSETLCSCCENCTQECAADI